jgi:hypothetical protein
LTATNSSVLLSSSDSAIKLEQWPNIGRVGLTRFGVADVSFNYAAPLNQWVNITLVNTGVSSRLYSDCALTDVLSMVVPLPLARIGYGSNGEAANAVLDEVRIYNYALSDVEIAGLCQSVSPASTPTATSEPTASTTPTAISTPTATSEPTSTPTAVPSSTPVMTPVAVPIESRTFLPLVIRK